MSRTGISRSLRQRRARRLLDSVSARLLAIILLSVVPLAVLDGLLAWHNYQSTVDASSNRASMLAETLKAQADQQIADAQQMLRALARQPELRDPAQCASLLRLTKQLQTVPLSALGLWRPDGTQVCDAGGASPGAGPALPVGRPVPAAGSQKLSLIPMLSGDGSTRRPVLRLSLTQSGPDGFDTLVADMPLGWTRLDLQGGDLVDPRSGHGGDTQAWLVGPAGADGHASLVSLCSDCGWSTDAVPARTRQAPGSGWSLRRLVAPVDPAEGRALRQNMVGDLGLLVTTTPTHQESRALLVFLRRLLAILLLLMLGVVAVAIGANVLIVAPLQRVTRSVTDWRRGGAFAATRDRLTPIELRQLSRTFSQATRSLAAHEERLRRAEEKQELLIKEIHHRVKNNLQIIASLLNLQANRIRQPEARAEFASARDRVRALATLHRHLYSEGELDTLNMRSFLIELCGQLFQAIGEKQGQRIKLKIEAPEIVMSTDQAVPLALVVTEAVSNAIKYAFPGGRSGTVSVTLAEEVEGIATLVIEDDGVGIPAGRAETEMGIRDGLGIQLIRGFARQLGATLEVIEGPEPGSPDHPDASTTGFSGTRYTLMVPLHPKIETYDGADDAPVSEPAASEPAPAPA